MNASTPTLRIATRAATGSLVALTLCLWNGADAAPADGGLPLRHPHTEPQPLDSSWTPFTGEPFFLLTDATYGSDEPAKVRLEVNSPEALAQTGGVDLRLYRVPDPLGFLQKQKNLHRVQVDAPAAPPSAANALTHLWDSWMVKARTAWRQLFSVGARRAVVAQAPALKTPAGLNDPSVFEEPIQYRPVPGLALVERFRYPVQVAAAIAPPKDLKLEGSSSNFITPDAGNVFVPLGKRAPGLYLVEALAGNYRATALLFVSDSVAMTKVSGEQMLVWSVRRRDGAPVAATKVVWSDGLGALKTGSTDAAGLLGMDRKSPEQTYVFGTDPQGGVFVSENFYYDSEVYAPKVYAVTDRPLYRPGDTVHVHVSGREFVDARSSNALQDGELGLTVVDPAGQPVLTQSTRFSGTQGGDLDFALPDEAPGGGYELRMTLGGDAYTAAFRVSEYQKPHFDIGVQPDKPDFKTGETVGGLLQLNYPDGKPVAHARVNFSARAQALAMSEGDLDYGGQFPLKLSQNQLETDDKGQARFALPAADQPSRYVITALATDGAAYRVRTSRELLVERGGTSWHLAPDRQFSRPGETVSYQLSASRRSTALPGIATTSVATAASGAQETAAPRPMSWEWLRLEDRSQGKGTLPGGASFQLTYPRPGSYTLTLRDDRGRVVAAASHWVSGEGLKAPAGTVDIVFDHAQYHPGDTAEALVSFPEPVEHALLTLERDKVESTALLGAASSWARSERIGPTQWRVRIPVRADMSPNVTFSVAYVKDGDDVFQNQGLRVEQPRIALAFTTTKAVYAPGERVDVDVGATLAGKPVVADLNVGVVDEMIYALQPEIAPRIEDFFFHPRRNNVRTSTSSSFIGYDLATSRLGELPARGQVNERAVKVLERPRRDDVDTAAWVPRLTTDASGHARFSFTMPDSLTRWRLTGRAMDARGNVGQQVAWVRSDKPFYAKWTSPSWQREGDRSIATLALFNQTGAEAAVDWSVQGAGIDRRATATLKPGVNFVDVPLDADPSGGLTLHLALRHDGAVVDQLTQPLARIPVAWRGPRELRLALGTASATALSMPADATGLQLSFAQDPAAGEFSRWMDVLIDDPDGGVEQTASRMLPLSIALQSLTPSQQPEAGPLAQRLASARVSLAHLAGPQARFGWWGRGMEADPFLTAYAYFADWRATQALHLGWPASQGQALLEAYAAGGPRLPPLQRALALSWMQEMGLPVRGLLGALLDELGAQDRAVGTGSPYGGSYALGGGDSGDANAMALVLAVDVAGRAHVEVAPAVRARVDTAAARLSSLDAPFGQALLMATQRLPADGASQWLAQARPDLPSFDRAQVLLWLQRALGHAPVEDLGDAPTLPPPWRRAAGANGQPVWRWPADQPLPTALPPVAGAAWAYLDFQSQQAPSPNLPVHLTRRLWKLVPVQNQAKTADADGTPAASGHLSARLQAVAAGSRLDADALYLDEIEVRSEQPLRRALVEVALPPGASVEGSTWGIDLVQADGKTAPLERAQQQDIAQGYAVPVDSLAANQTINLRHLLRFSQRGRFKLPPVRLQRMYDPEAKAVDPGKGWAAMEVE